MAVIVEILFKSFHDFSATGYSFVRCDRWKDPEEDRHDVAFELPDGKISYAISPRAITGGNYQNASTTIKSLNGFCGP